MRAFLKGKVRARKECTVYTAAAFSNSVADIAPIAIPLWLAALGMEPFLIGMVIGTRYLGPLFFSIQGGALMDRLGTRRVMIIFSAMASAVPLLYPQAGWLPFILCLQLVGGLSESICWSGAQTLTNQVFKGKAVYSGRMIAATRVGTLLGPPFAGLMVEIFGGNGGFLAMSIWGAGTLVAVCLLPPSAINQKNFKNHPGKKGVLPSLEDYISTFKLMAIPAVATLMAITSMRQIGSSMQNSFYTVYLGNAGISEAFIGLLIAMNGLAGIAAVWTGRLTIFVKEENLLFMTTGLSILSIALIPISTNIWFLFIMSAVRGFCLAVSVALLLVVLSKQVNYEFQGRVIGLRMTCHQVLNVFIPVLLGTVVQFSGISAGFYCVGFGAILFLFILKMFSGREKVVS